MLLGAYYITHSSNFANHSDNDKTICYYVYLFDKLLLIIVLIYAKRESQSDLSRRFIDSYELKVHFWKISMLEEKILKNL